MESHRPGSNQRPQDYSSFYSLALFQLSYGEIYYRPDPFVPDINYYSPNSTRSLNPSSKALMNRTRHEMLTLIQTNKNTNLLQSSQ